MVASARATPRTPVDAWLDPHDEESGRLAARSENPDLATHANYVLGRLLSEQEGREREAKDLLRRAAQARIPTWR